MELDTIGILGGAFGTLVSAFGLYFVYRQLAIQSRTDTADFVLRMEESFTSCHYETFVRLSEGGKWGSENGQDLSNEDIVSIESYLGFFSNFRIVLDRGIVSMDTLDRAFAYRYFTGANSPVAQQVIAPKLEYWEDLCALHKKWIKHRKLRQRPIPNAEHDFALFVLRVSGRKN